MGFSEEEKNMSGFAVCYRNILFKENKGYDI